jgi:hypothetical protein
MTEVQWGQCGGTTLWFIGIALPWDAASDALVIPGEVDAGGVIVAHLFAAGVQEVSDDSVTLHFPMLLVNDNFTLQLAVAAALMADTRMG